MELPYIPAGQRFGRLHATQVHASLGLPKASLICLSVNGHHRLPLLVVEGVRVVALRHVSQIGDGLDVAVLSAVAGEALQQAAHRQTDSHTVGHAWDSRDK
jgi:hypothetical protein